jgi:hypothetical protein
MSLADCGNFMTRFCEQKDKGMKQLKYFSATAMFLMLISTNAHAAPSAEIMQKIVDQGVPEDALNRLVKFMDENKGKNFTQDAYSCEGKDPASIVPCDDPKRIKGDRTVTVGTPDNVAIIDFAAPSTTERFYMINLKTGVVQKFLAAHGLGSGKGNYATKFSNQKDSRQTSLGIFLTGDIYYGHFGPAVRMYGLQSSNDQSYNRDIVMHGAWYAESNFIDMVNQQTGARYGRLGLSWGCPAVGETVIPRVAQSLSNGSLVMHYYYGLMDKALSGKEVVAPSSQHNPKFAPEEI